ncbi:bifunctional nuclease family protein [Luteolibacter algae]|uniref:Bifunctional nuclease family protein n=1 Tax=Luteolibacter algae TaxID=454151 RepID=A0ABW5D924_9BACT
MPDPVRVEIIALLPTQAGCAVFLGNGDKVMLFYIDPAIGMAINTVMSGQQMPRPLTHDLYMLTLQAFGSKVTRVLINAVDGDVYYARLFLTAENEIMERKFIEIDARPSDCLAIATRAEAPIFVAKDVWDAAEDRSQILEEMQNEQDPDDDLKLEE